MTASNLFFICELNIFLSPSLLLLYYLASPSKRRPVPNTHTAVEGALKASQEFAEREYEETRRHKGDLVADYTTYILVTHKSVKRRKINEC